MNRADDFQHALQAEGFLVTQHSRHCLEVELDEKARGCRRRPRSEPLGYVLIGGRDWRFVSGEIDTNLDGDAPMVGHYAAKVVCVLEDTDRVTNSVEADPASEQRVEITEVDDAVSRCGSRTDWLPADDDESDGPAVQVQTVIELHRRREESEAPAKAKVARASKAAPQFELVALDGRDDWHAELAQTLAELNRCQVLRLASGQLVAAGQLLDGRVVRYLHAYLAPQIERAVITTKGVRDVDSFRVACIQRLGERLERAQLVAREGLSRKQLRSTLAADKKLAKRLDSWLLKKFELSSEDPRPSLEFDCEDVAAGMETAEEIDLDIYTAPRRRADGGRHDQRPQ